MGRNWLQFNPRRTPIVSVRIPPDRYRALIDTGADVSLIGPELSLRLGLPSIGTQIIVDLSGNRQVLQAVQLPPIGFGNIDLIPVERQYPRFHASACRSN